MGRGGCKRKEEEKGKAGLVAMQQHQQPELLVVDPAVGLVAQREAFLAKAIDAMGRYLAGLLSARCTEFVQRGNFRALTRYETTFDSSRPNCRSCGLAVQNQVLCDACRRIAPAVRYGPTVVDSMYRSSHPRYEITRDKEHEMLMLRQHMRLATDALMLTCTFVNVCWKIRDSAHRNNVESEWLNVRFDREAVEAEGNYGRAISCGTAFPVPVGGFGVELRERIHELAYEWLKHVDQSVRVWFDVPVSRTEDEAASVDNCVRRLARLIADRVALLDRPHEGRADQHLSSEGCDHLAELQHLRCKYYAENSARNDVMGMGALIQIVSVQLEKQSAIALLVAHRVKLLSVLSVPPPELLRALPTVVRDYNLSTLRDVLGNQQQYSVGAMATAVLTWRSTINGAAFCVLLEKARHEANVWTRTSNLLCAVFLPRPDQCEATPAFGALPPAALRHPAARLPAAGWTRGGASWYLVPQQRHRSRRTGLDPPGLRVVLLCSIVHRLLADGQEGEEGTSVFRPGQVALDVLCPLATAATQRGAHTYDQLKNQLQPLTIGMEWSATKTELKRWKVSHIDNDVRDAVRHLSDYSFVQLEALFKRGARHRHLPRLLAAVRERMVFKPPVEYTDFVASALEWALPIVREYRQSIGFADTARSDPVGDLLRMHPAVRGWSLSDGELRLTVKDLRGAPPVLKLKLDELCKERRLVVKRRPKRGACWTYCLSESELFHVLSARDAWG